MADFVWPERLYFVGTFNESEVSFCLVNHDEDSAVVAFTEELLAERWRDEFQPDKQITEVGRFDAIEGIAKLRRGNPSINYLAVDPTTTAVEGRTDAVFFALPEREGD